jgi:DNA helicase-2/ATP-dependent DNA helicase PcrA
LIDCDPSRFLEEIDEKYLNTLSPVKDNETVSNKFVNRDIFGSPEPSKIRFKKPVQRTQEIRKKSTKPTPVNRPVAKNLKKVSEVKQESNLFGSDLLPGNRVSHQKFGNGEVMSIEGNGSSKKAEIQFESGERKKLLLQFAKLKIIG